MKRLKLGELLLQEDLIDQKILDAAIELQKESGEKFGRVLIDMKAVDESKLLELLARQLSISYIDLNFYDMDVFAAQLLPETYARRYRALVLQQKDNELLVAMADPLDISAYDAISGILKRPIKLAIASESGIVNAFDRIYRRTQEISHFARELSSEIVDDYTLTDDLFEEVEGDDDERAPVAKLLNSLFRDAVQARASDIHIEPGKNALRIRFRIDGVLHESMLDDRRIVNPLIQRLKLRAHLDIAERRLPQDGRFNFAINNRVFDVRLSTIPTSDGESVVMRLLDQSSPVNDLGQLGISADMIARLERNYTRPYGMLLVTGPTGSGKTTTLYSILSRLNVAETKIITVEDPVEYSISRVNQVQVNTKVDLTFARVLRSILRQDPDVIMVGEIRDQETARIAMRAAVTGHFVLATLHTNEAFSSALRLIDMGAEGYMVASAVKAILGQRLVRTICKACKQAHVPDVSECIWLETMGIGLDTPLKVGLGCSHCNQSGYAGRVGVYELLELDANMLDALRKNDASLFAKAALGNKNYQPLSAEVVTLLKSGKTSVYEAIRVIGQLDEVLRFQEPDKKKKRKK